MEKDETEQNFRLNAHSAAFVSTRMRVTGIVQGVGFRPFIFRLATEIGLRGSVCNKGGSVEIELTSAQSKIYTFLKRMQSEVPPVARIDSVEILEITEVAEIESQGRAIFEIVASQIETNHTSVEIPPDIATCRDCLTELFDPKDRRYRYPFLNCTNCGPRFTVIQKLPYDRAATTMACFPMCPDCNNEYLDPRNRRFHAQPNACWSCGPTLAFYDPKNQKPDNLILFDHKSDRPLEKTIAALSAGQIVAIKGLGGFHLVCDATNDDAVVKLRHRKGRAAKPFAIIVPSTNCLVNYCHVTASETAILEGQFRPIVLLSKRFKLEEGLLHERMDSAEFTAPISTQIAPQVKTLGVMLPYTPLHHLLLHDFAKPLVMTSANFSEEPIVAGNREAVLRLSTIADAFLFHNRDIVSRYDDTVTRVIDNTEMVIRRARGYAPRAIELAFRAAVPVLSLGGHLKNTFCLIKGDKAYVSQHIGDLDTVETIENFENTLRGFLEIFDISPQLLAIDMHPDYGSTKLVQSWLSNKSHAPVNIDDIRQTVSVQHHHAHIVSCMAEHRINEPVIGVAFDGIGYGVDGNLWGGEFLHCSFESFDRVARFKYVRMPGGVNAIREPWRMALSFLASCSPRIRNSKTAGLILDRFSLEFGKKNVFAVYSKLANSELAPSTSSCGRLFDAVSALLGLCETTHYEGQAAIVLESCATSIDNKILPNPYFFKLDSVSEHGKEIIEIDSASIIESVLEDMENHAKNELIAVRFHETIANVIAMVCKRLRAENGIDTACLSGGVFQNQLLLCRTKKLLETDGFKVFTNNLVPANDGGLSLGQAAIALAKAKMIEF